MAYSKAVGVDSETLEFPPGVRQAFAESPELSATFVGQPNRPGVAIATLPMQVNTQRRWIQSAYSQDNITTWGGYEVAVITGHDTHAWLCKREVGTEEWETVDLTTISVPFGVQVDDSHATWSLAVDVNGRLMVTGNAHTTIAQTALSGPDLDLTTWSAIAPSTHQQGVTYDKFVILDDGTILRMWREGLSTEGAEYVARWNPATLVFEAEAMLLDGGPSDEGPYTWHVAARGQKVGVFFCWRGSGDASTNSDMCYIESPDGGVTWQTITGGAVSLPVTHATAPVIRAIPSGSGLINQGGSDLDRDGRPHVAYLMQVGTTTQIIHTYWDGSGWQHEQVSQFKQLIPTAGNTTLMLTIARPQIVCTDLGRTYVIGRTDEGMVTGAPFMIDATPGADHTPFLIASMNLYHWEPAFDSRALREQGLLKILLAPTDPNKDSKQVFVRQWAGILTIDMNQIEQVRAGQVRIPTIRSVATYTWGPEIIVGTTAESNYVGTTVYVATAADGTASQSIQIGPGVPHIPAGDGNQARHVSIGSTWFARQSVRTGFVNGATSANLKLRETPSAGSLTQTDVAHLAIPNNSYTGVKETPFCPLPGTPFVEADGQVRDTRLVPRVQSNVASGLRVGGWLIEVGVLDWT